MRHDHFFGGGRAIATLSPFSATAELVQTGCWCNCVSLCVIENYRTMWSTVVEQPKRNPSVYQVL